MRRSGVRGGDDVRDVDAAGVLLLKRLELVAQEKVRVRVDAPHEADAGLVCGVLEDSARELVHGRNARAARNQRDVRVLVRRPLHFRNGAQESELVAWLQRVDVRALLAPRVVLDHQLDKSLLVCGRCQHVIWQLQLQIQLVRVPAAAQGRSPQSAVQSSLTEIIGRGVWPEHRLPATARERNGQQRRAEREAAGLAGIGQLEPELLGVAVDELGAVQLQTVDAELGEQRSPHRRRGARLVVHKRAEADDGGGDSDLGAHDGAESGGVDWPKSGSCLGHGGRAHDAAGRSVK